MLYMGWARLYGECKECLHAFVHAIQWMDIAVSKKVVQIGRGKSHEYFDLWTIHLSRNSFIWTGM